MLFCYPLNAAEENWLHDGIIDLIVKSLTQANLDLTEVWLKSFPTNKHEELKRKRSLFEKLNEVVSAVGTLKQPDKEVLLKCLHFQNNLPSIFDGVTPSVSVPADAKPELIKVITELFELAFRLLGALGIRDRQYEKVHKKIPARVCAFCGIETLSAPIADIPREDLDHYLALSLFPFAGVNLRNLAPMGHKCNSSHKLTANVLFDQKGTRRRCFDPYGERVAKVSLLSSRPLQGATIDMFVLPDWQIDLIGEPEETATWDEIFAIRTRYRANILDVEMRSWIDHFAQWWDRESIPAPTNTQTVVELLRRYLHSVVQEGFADHTFLKRAVFEMLAHQCNQPTEGGRVVDWIISLLSPETGAVLPARAT